MNEHAHLANWSAAAIDEQCESAYGRFKAGRTDAYKAWFAAHPALRQEGHLYKAKDFASALPDGADWLGELLPAGKRHRHHLSGNSSQMLALALLGLPARREPSMRWLTDVLHPAVEQPVSARPTLQFEYEPASAVLDEKSYKTNVDLLIDDPAVVVCLEAKWVEQGMGTCLSCPDVATADCSKTILGRRKYWEAANDIMHLREREPGRTCPLHHAYQCARNVALAHHLGGGRRGAVFALVYDSTNPYFTQTGSWPGWPVALDATLNYMDSPVRFASISWQELVKTAPLEPLERAWASEKHGLE